MEKLINRLQIIKKCYKHEDIPLTAYLDITSDMLIIIGYKLFGCDICNKYMTFRVPLECSRSRNTLHDKTSMIISIKM